MDTSAPIAMIASGTFPNYLQRRGMPDSKEALQRRLANYQKELREYETKLKNEKDDKKKVHLAMSVAGLKNSIKEIGAQLRNM